MIKGFFDEGEESHSPKAPGRWCIVISRLHKSKENSKKKKKKIKKKNKKLKIKKKFKKKDKLKK